MYEYGTRQLASYAVSDSVTALCLLPYETASGGELILLDRDGAVRKSHLCPEERRYGERLHLGEYGGRSGRRTSSAGIPYRTVPP